MKANHEFLSQTGYLKYLRTYFSAMAMQGLCVGKVSKDIMQGQCVDIAQEAVQIADQLIQALNKAQ